MAFELTHACREPAYLPSLRRAEGRQEQEEDEPGHRDSFLPFENTSCRGDIYGYVYIRFNLYLYLYLLFMHYFISFYSSISSI